ncbi:LysE/ArgO family amino acid transporter [Gymnodinialimonas ceratoperidinii]|uniref:LysE/ArgO family amino acid transporter n=1 Tax=Gymnodinialimonas ceratoperidinii TaxID=2856823 RepID=A0A8F6YC65_9RHOB|nr:LysE/ArgO family amino acid transporter [Gymnodinialimonas ceratoperidinii]QXT40896.1 LysE/ArgO family amino acid transporter [Gymnodinialimonas ceratoperidinii]
MNAFLVGFGVSISLILAIGAQNAFVLRQGLQRQHVALVVTICALTDALLIGVGVFSIGWMTSEAAWLGDALLYGGAAFLIFYGAKSFHSAWTGSGALKAAGEVVQSWQTAALTCIAVTWLNPHMYLDTVVLVGSVSAQYPDAKLTFWLGAVLASFTFFVSLGFGARLLAPVFATRRAWIVLDIFVGALMWAIAAKLLLSSGA